MFHGYLYGLRGLALTVAMGGRGVDAADTHARAPSRSQCVYWEFCISNGIKMHSQKRRSRSGVSMSKSRHRAARCQTILSSLYSITVKCTVHTVWYSQVS